MGSTICPSGLTTYHMKARGSPATNWTAMIFGSVVVALVAMVGVTSALLFPHNSFPPPASYFDIGSTTVKSVDGLALSLLLNSTRIRPGQGISITVREPNPLSTVNNVSASTDWPLRGLNVGPCGPLNFPVGVAIIQGYYTSSSVSAGRPLGLYQPGEYSCPAMLSEIGSYVFEPSSDRAGIVGSCTPEPCFTENMSSTIGAKGYWVENLLPGAAFSEFSPGLYTAVGGDEWGTLAVLHFLVTQTTGVQGLVLRVVQDSSGQPMGGVTVTAGPASSKKDVVFTPGGPALKECVHGVESGSTILNNGSVIFPNRTRVTYPPCPAKTYETNSTGWISISNATGQYYFFRVGGINPSTYGIVELFQDRTTYVTVSMPSGDYIARP